LSKRIRSSNVQLGESFIVGHSPKFSAGSSFDDGELSKEELHLQHKEKEFKQKLDQMLLDSQHQANTIIEEAKNKAAQLLEEVKQTAKTQEEEFELFKNNTLEETRQAGMQLGFEEGYQKASEEVFSKVINLEAIANSSFNLKKEIILSAELEILQLSIVIAEKILKKQLEIKPEMITEIIRAAINELKDKEEIKIIVNPALKEQLYDFSEELKTVIKGMKSIKIVEDKTIHANSAIIESPESRIDARLETQIAKITEELMKTFEEEPVLADIINDCHSELDSESVQRTMTKKNTE